MQTVARTRENRLGGHGQVRRQQRRAEHALGTATTTSLAGSFGQALPTLNGIAKSYSHEFRAELLYELCAALVAAGLGTPEGWAKSEGAPLLFARHSMMAAIGEERWNLLQRNVEYCFEINDRAEEDGYSEPLGEGRLALTIAPAGSGFLKIGPALEAMEREHDGLGAAFYWTLTYALYPVMRLYNHDDAFQYEERMREYAEEEDQGNPEQYEFPDVQRALPECIRETLAHQPGIYKVKARKLMLRHRQGPFGAWIDRVRKIDQLSRIRVRSVQDFQMAGNYDSAPLPSFLIAFQEQDAVIAAFDEESNYMLEGNPEPTLGVVFSPSNFDEVQEAVRAASRFITLNCELCSLIEDITEWEKANASQRVDRGEPSLRTS